jgi:hypothetical protein
LTAAGLGVWITAVDDNDVEDEDATEDDEEEGTEEACSTGLVWNGSTSRPTALLLEVLPMRADATPLMRPRDRNMLAWDEDPAPRLRLRPDNLPETRDEDDDDDDDDDDKIAAVDDDNEAEPMALPPVPPPEPPAPPPFLPTAVAEPGAVIFCFHLPLRPKTRRYSCPWSTCESWWSKASQIVDTDRHGTRDTRSPRSRCRMRDAILTQALADAWSCASPAAEAMAAHRGSTPPSTSTCTTTSVARAQTMLTTERATRVRWRECW